MYCKSYPLHPWKVWEQFIDDAYSILKPMPLENFLHLINSLYQNNKFIIEGERTSVSWHFIKMK